MTLIELMQEWEQVSQGLDVYSQVTFIRLALIWNRLRRPEWFLVSRAELLRATGIRSKDTIDKARKKLEEKGFIESIAGGRGKLRKYRLTLQPSKLSDSLLEEESRLPHSHLEEERRLSHSLGRLSHSHLEEERRLSHSHQKATTQPPEGYHIAISQRERDTEENLSEEVVAEKDERSTTPTTEVNKEVLNFYQNNIRPICSSFELERLGQDAEMYGNDAVIKAIERAVLRGRRNLGYIEGILRRWQADGYDEEGDRDADNSRSTGKSQGQSENTGETAEEWAERVAKEMGF
jgi:DnaD/phage-associated family protein